MPKDQAQITKNMNAWKRQRGYGRESKRVRIAELCDMERDEELKVMFAEMMLDGDGKHNMTRRPTRETRKAKRMMNQ